VLQVHLHPWSPTGIARGTLLHAPGGRHPGQTLPAFIHGQSPWPSAAGVKKVTANPHFLISPYVNGQICPSLAVFFLPIRQARGVGGDFQNMSSQLWTP